MPHQWTPEQEQQSVERARHGGEGIRDLYRYFVSPVYAYVAYRVGSADDAEDLTSETFLRVVEHLDTFQWRGVHSLRAWIFRIAHNVVQDWQRRRHRQAPPLDVADLPQLRSHALLPEDQIVQQERFAQLYRLIRTLSPRRQEIITLRFFGELRNSEIAVILDLDERTVASHLCRGLDDLQRKFAEEDSHEHIERRT